MNSNRFKDRYSSFAYLRSSHYMGLSLYILLLAFFIALTSLFDVSPDRAQNVMFSVKNSFYQTRSPIDPIMAEALKNQNAGQAGILPKKQIKELLGSSIGDLRIDEETDQDGHFQMSAHMSQAIFSNYLDAFSRKLYEIISNTELSSRFDVVIMIDASYGDIALLKRVLNSFQESEFPMNRLAVGLSGSNEAQDVELKFIFPAPYKAEDAFGAPQSPALNNETGASEE